MLDHRGQLLRAALGFRRASPPIVRPSPLGAALLARLLVWYRTRRGRHGPPGLRSPTHAVRREGLAGDVLYERDGAFADERHGHRVGAHAVADDAAGGVGVRTALTFPLRRSCARPGLLVVPGLPLSIPDLKAVGVKTKPSPTIRAKQAHPVSRRYPEPASIAGLTEAVAVTVPKLNRVVTRKAAVFNPPGELDLELHFLGRGRDLGPVATIRDFWRRRKRAPSEVDQPRSGIS